MRALVAGILLTLVTSAVAHATPTTPYDLTPFAESHPALAEAAMVLDREKASKTQLRAALSGLPFTAAGADPADPVAEATAHWLAAQLLTQLGDDATDHYEALANDPAAAFRDEALTWIAKRSTRGGDRFLAAEQLLSRHPASPGFLDGALEAADTAKKRLRKKATNPVIATLEHTLAQSMRTADRQALTLALAQAYWAQKQKTEAQTLLHRLWWETGDKSVRKQLKRYKLSLGWVAIRARAALRDTGRDLTKTEARFRRIRAKKGFKYGLKRWGMTVSRMRRDRTASLTSLRRLRSVRRTLERRRSFRPLMSYGLGLAQDGRGEDATAIERFRTVFEQSPRHPIALDAADRARSLLNQLDKHAEALAVDEWLVQHAPRGTIHRDALWRTAFEALMSGDSPEAEARLETLSRSYGHQRAGTGLIWEAQARYWLARNAELAGQGAAAQARYTEVTQRFPGTWYGRLARQRLGNAAPPAVDPEAIPRTAGLDTVVALARLGDTRAALSRLWTLRRAGYFRLLGRRLRDAIKSGKTAASPEVATQDPASEDPDGDEDEADSADATPFETHRSALEAAALEHGIDPALIAAIAYIETRFNADAVSRAGAMGMCQLMPATGEALGKRLYGPDFATDRLTDPAVNLRLAAYHLARVRDAVGAHPVLLLAAYNAGHARAKRWFAESGTLPVDAFVERITFPQARRYVQTVLTAAESMRRQHWPSHPPTPIPMELRQPQ